MTRTKERQVATKKLLSRLGRVGLGVVASLLPGLALAEGSRSLYPAGYEAAYTDEGRANLDLTGGATVYLGVVQRRTFIYVYAQAGENILLGSRNRISNNAGTISLYSPQSFGTKGAETIPGAADFTCSAGTDGLIATRAQELAGPQSVDGTGNLSGFVPCHYTAPTEGIYGVLFSATGSTDTNGVIDPPATAKDSVSAWDVTVRGADTASTTDITGRVFTYAWSAYTAGNGANKRLYSNLYYVTDDGYRYRQSLKGIDPNGGTFFANALGFRDKGEPLYKDIRGLNQTVATGLPAGVTSDGAQFPIFFSDVSATGGTDIDATLGALGIPAAPKPPQVNAFSFVYPPASSSTSYVGQGGTFNFHVTDTISFQIIISRDGVDWDPVTTTNRVLTGTSGTGDYAITWDGKDNAGNNFPVGGGYKFRITGRNGEAHFPFVDVEGNFYGGPALTKLNGNTIDSIVYYDDRGYVTKGGTAVGTLNGNICGNTGWAEPSPLFSLLGVDSSDANLSGSGKYYRWWPEGANNNNDCVSTGQAYGDAKALNLWTYQSTTPQSNTFDIIDAADVTATVSAPVSVAAGGSVSVNVAFGNVGSQAAADAVYTLSLPAGLTNVSCGGATCGYDAGTGVVTVSGLPGSLSAGQWVNMSLSYTAPATGNVPVSAAVSTTTSQGPNLATDTAGAITLVGGSTTADVLTTVAAPAASVAGGVVAVTVSYANAGAADASISAYSLSLPSGLSDVSCSGSGVSCSYAAGTGVVTVSGLPATLPAGASLPFSLRYTAPASGIVTVNSSITPAGADTNPANNAASGATTVMGSGADVVSSVSAPATATPGSVVKVPVSFGNTGAASASGVAYSLTVPAGLTGVSCAAPAVCSYSGTTVSVTGLPATLASGEWASLMLSYNAPASGVVPVQASVSTVSAETNTANNSANGSTTIVTSASGADVSVTLAPPTSAAPGASVSVPVTFANGGQSAAAGVTYSLSLPPGLSGVSCSGGGVTCTYNASTGAVTLSGLPTALSSGQNAAFSVRYTAPAAGAVQVNASIATSTAETSTANNTATGSTSIVNATTADVTTTVSPPASAVAGSTVTVPVSFSNIGANTAAGVSYTLSLSGAPAGVAVSYNGNPCTYSGGAVTGCSLPASLAPGESIALSLSYTAPSSGSLTVTASVATTTAESNSANNSAHAPTSFQAPDMRIDLSTLPASARAGAPYTGSFTCSNIGTAAAATATTCTLSGLPTGVTVGACTLSGGSPWVAGDAVPAGQMVTCAVSGTPTSTGGLSLNGSTGASGDSNPANNTAVRALTVSKLATPVPTLSAWALLLLALMLVAGARPRRRQG